MPLFKDPFHLAFHPAEFDGRQPFVLPETIDDSGCWCSRTATACAARR